MSSKLRVTFDFCPELANGLAEASAPSTSMRTTFRDEATL